MRLRGDAVAALARSLRLPSAFVPATRQEPTSLFPHSALSFAVNTPGAFCPVRFAARAPLLSHAGVADALHAFFGDPSAQQYTVACAYLDHSGAALLLAALARGADVTLVAPATPNVYAHANRAALSRLIRDAASTPGRLRCALHPATMMHAKAAVAVRADGSLGAYLGSANLKQRSLTQFGELLLRVEGDAARELQDALHRLAGEAEDVSAESAKLLYDPTRAAIETWLG